MKTEVKKAKELQELVAILVLVKPNLALDELTPLATTMYEAGSSSQAAAQAQGNKGGDMEVSIDDSLGAIVAHLRNIQVQSQIDKEHTNIIQQQSLHMAIINDELKDKLL